MLREGKYAAYYEKACREAEKAKATGLRALEFTHVMIDEAGQVSTLLTYAPASGVTQASCSSITAEWFPLAILQYHDCLPILSYCASGCYSVVTLTLTVCRLPPGFMLQHLHNVQTRFYCPQAFLSLVFRCRDDVPESIEESCRCMTDMMACIRVCTACTGRETVLSSIVSCLTIS